MPGIYNYPQTLDTQTVTNATAVDLNAVLSAAGRASSRPISGWAVSIETNNARMGDSTISATKGVLLEAGAKLLLDKSGGPLFFIATAGDATINATVFYAAEV